ncbi:unnamed protein product, partial [marine sediment metagenome]
MPKQKRWTIKRHLDQVILHLDNAVNLTVLVGHEFEAPHPDYYEAFCLIATMVTTIKERVI